MAAAVPIGIAVVERDGSYLVGVRPEGTPLAGYAEFPGGKCEPAEPPIACAVRECAEETGLAVEPLWVLDVVTWEYPHGTVELHFVHCRPALATAEPAPPFRWVPRQELATMRFPEANGTVLRALSALTGS